MKSTDCGGRASSHHSIQLLVEIDPADRPRLVVKYIPGDDIVDPRFDSTGLWQECHFESNNVELLRETSRFRSLILYNCGSLMLPLGSDTMAAFYFELRRGDTQLTSIPSPYIWLSNGEEQRQDANPRLTYTQAVRSYLPLWELRPGFHVEAEAKLITRKLIKSSIWRDIILNTDPIYSTLSLYPIFDLGTSNYSNRSIASARISTRLKPGFVYLRDRITPPYQSSRDMCDFIEDYRSGTIFDVLGSVGGLFALLQAIHIFLFGRPLFWGLTGAKLISPFGLLGGISSKKFKRRLGKQYHRRSTEDNSIKIQIEEFLRDFIIDFGPAEINPDLHSPRSSGLPSPELTVEGDEQHDSPIPLARMGSDTASRPVSQGENDRDSGDDRNTIRSSECVDEVV
ncbi:unnamed protein product [Rhizoctonia solani]|uniref:Uncharacterized protein n=1 Tax=Rhizoctonia solani TaxID=456999 RepID=A0A8H3H3G8_9AGAM|nr:unnamed protein product [Rhizoctonia solani]